MSQHAKELIGPPIAKCPSCHIPFKTGMKYWPEMSVSEKTWYVLRDIALLPYTIFFYAFIFCFIPAVIIEIFADWGEFYDKHFSLAMCYAAIVAVGLVVFYIREMITKIGLRPQSDEIPYWNYQPPKADTPT